MLFTELWNGDRLGGPEKEYAARLYEVFFALPGHVQDEMKAAGGPPKRAAIAANFGLTIDAVDLLLAVMTAEPRMPKLFRRHPETRRDRGRGRGAAQGLRRDPRLAGTRLRLGREAAAAVLAARHCRRIARVLGSRGPARARLGVADPLSRLPPRDSEPGRARPAPRAEGAPDRRTELGRCPGAERPGRRAERMARGAEASATRTRRSTRRLGQPSARTSSRRSSWSGATAACSQLVLNERSLDELEELALPLIETSSTGAR